MSHPTRGTTSVADILIMREKVRNNCYATARRFNKLKFEDVNPYAPGEAREDWNPMTGSKRQTKKPPTGPKTTSQPEAGPATTTKTPTPKAYPKKSGYKGQNFDPNYSQRSRERSQLEKRPEERRQARK